MDSIVFIRSVNAIVERTTSDLLAAQERSAEGGPEQAALVHQTTTEVVRDIMALLDGTKAIEPDGRLGRLELWYEDVDTGARSLLNDFDQISLEDEWAALR